MEQKSLDLAKFGITTVKNNFTVEQKNALSKLSPIYAKISSIVADEEKDNVRLKEIREELKVRNKKLLQEMKDLKQSQKVRNEQKLVLLGARAAYIKNAKELGVQFEQNSVAQITAKAASKKQLVEAELEV